MVNFKRTLYGKPNMVFTVDDKGEVSLKELDMIRKGRPN